MCVERSQSKMHVQDAEGFGAGVEQPSWLGVVELIR